MHPKDDRESASLNAAFRDGKDRVVAEVVGVAEEHGIRVMRGGGTVFARHGLISPKIARFAALIVDPPHMHDLTEALVADGWTWCAEKRRRVLPPTIRSFERADFNGTLNLYGIIPGFFADPQATFERIWTLREQMVFAGRPVAVLGKLPTVMFAAHNRLDGQRWTRASGTHFTYFLAQFQDALSVDERIALQQFARDLAAEDEVRRMLLGLELEPGAAAHPDDAYVRLRLGLERPTAGDAWLVTRLERPRGRRDPFPGIAEASAALLRLFGARRRLRL